MKLFFQLTEDQQNDMIHRCVHLVIDDMMEDNIQLEPITTDDLELKTKMESAVAHVKTLATEDEKMEYLLHDNEDVAKAIYDIAIEMAKGSFYHEENETVFYIDEHDEDFIDDEDVIMDGEVSEDNLLPESSKTKKISHLN